MGYRTFVRVIHVTTKCKSMLNPRKQLKLVRFLSALHNVDRFPAKLCAESVIDFRAGEE